MSDVSYLTRAWQYYVNFYRELSQLSGWPNQVAMLEFVERVAPAAIAENIVPGTSHHILYLSYAYRGRSPTVSIWCGGYYQQTKAPFSVSWSGRRNEAETFECIDDALWQRIVAKLKGLRGQMPGGDGLATSQGRSDPIAILGAVAARVRGATGEPP